MHPLATIAGSVHCQRDTRAVTYACNTQGTINKNTNATTQRYISVAQSLLFHYSGDLTGFSAMPYLSVRFFSDVRLEVRQQLDLWNNLMFKKNAD